MKVRVFWDLAPCNHPDYGEYSPLKRLFTPTRLHGAISQKVLIFIDHYRQFLYKLVESFPK
jgi:hypothetical protein